MTTPAGHPALPPGHRIRRPVVGDAAAVAALRVAVDVSLRGESDVTVDEVREEWALPRLRKDADLWLVEDGSGTVVGYGLCWVEAPAAVVTEQVVHPDSRGLGLSEVLLDLGEARAAESARAAAPAEGGDIGSPATLGVWAQEGDRARRALYARRGYRRVRTFYGVDRALDAPVDAPSWPRGVAAQPFRRGRDEAAVHAAAAEAFRDHFRPVEMNLEEWLTCRFSREAFDTELWFVAWDGDEVAGAVLALETPRGGYIDELFVRRPWRRGGLGRALLLLECAELRRRGLPLAYLGVDATNPTGALHLYETAGFVRSRTTFVYEKEIGGD
jgi:mycothiol synthase